MPPNDGFQVGSASIKITADTSQVGPAVDAVKAKVEEIGPPTKTLKEDADALWDSWKKGADDAVPPIENATKATKSLGDQIAELGPTAGAAAALVGAAFFQIGKEIGEALDELRSKYGKGSEEGEKFLQKIDAGKPIAQIGKIGEKIAELQTKLSDVQDASLVENLTKAGGYGLYLRVKRLEEVKKLQDEINTLKAQEKILDGRIAGERDDAEKERLRKEREQTQKAINDATNAVAVQARKEEEERQSLIERFLIGQQKQEEAVTKQAEKRLALETKIAEVRINGIIDARRELEAMYARQAAGFNGEGSNNSLQGSIDALEIAVRGAAARMGGI